MSYRPQLLRERSTDILAARNWAVGIIAGLCGVSMLVSELQRMDGLLNPAQIAYLLLFGCTGALIFLWIYASQRELDLCFSWLDPESYAPPDGFKETALIVFFGLLLSALLYAARNPLWYAAAFSLYSWMLIYGWGQVRREIDLGIQSSRKRAKSALASSLAPREVSVYVQGIDVLEEYFIKRPQVKRHVVIAVVSTLGLALALASHRQPESTALQLGVYALFILVIVGSEFVIAVWRSQRDSRLRPIRAELLELQRQENAARPT